MNRDGSNTWSSPGPNFEPIETVPRQRPLSQIPKELDDLAARMGGVAGRAELVGDFLSGSEPQSSGVGTDNPPSNEGFNGEVSRQIARLFAIVGRLELEMGRIERASIGS